MLVKRGYLKSHELQELKKQPKKYSELTSNDSFLSEPANKAESTAATPCKLEPLYPQ